MLAPAAMSCFRGYGSVWLVHACVSHNLLETEELQLVKVVDQL